MKSLITLLLITAISVAGVSYDTMHHSDAWDLYAHFEDANLDPDIYIGEEGGLVIYGVTFSDEYVAGDIDNAKILLSVLNVAEVSQHTSWHSDYLSVVFAGNRQQCVVPTSACRDLYNNLEYMSERDIRSWCNSNILWQEF